MNDAVGVPDHVGDPVGERRLFTGPNALTGLRLGLVPILAWLLFGAGDFNEQSRWWAAAVFVFAAITDVIDGAWARRQGSVTTVGKVADPIADKALTGVALIGLSWWGALPWWVTVVILAREVIVTVARFVVIRHGVIPASRGGKAKTMAQIVAITAFLVPVSSAWDPVRWIAMGIAIALTVVTGVDYLVRAVRLQRGVHSAVPGGSRPARGSG